MNGSQRLIRIFLALYPIRALSGSILLPALLCFTSVGLSQELSAKNLLQKDVRGCWALSVDRGLDSKPSSNRRWLVRICLFEGGALSGFVLEPTGEAESIQGVWRMTDSGILLDDEHCSIAGESDGRRIVLSSCRFAGHWDLTCRQPKSLFKCSNE